MKNVSPVMQRELNGYFYSPIAYAVMTIFLLISGVFFVTSTFIPGGESSLRSLFQVMPILLLVFLPVLTMRLLSEEYRSGTIETIMTAPVGETDVIVGKFLGAMVFYVAMLVGTLAYAVLLSVFGDLDVGLLAAAYLGLLLLGALYISVGLFFSACTQNQIIAVVCSTIVLMVFTLLADYLAAKQSGFLGLLLHQFSIQEHYEDFTRGLVDTNHLIFFTTTTVLFLFFAVKVMELRRWR